MLNVKEIELDNEGRIVAMKGIVSGAKKMRSPRCVFSKITNKIIYWADYELDYCGG